MRCQTCGNNNKPEHTFCAQCLEMLNKKTVVAVGNKKSVTMPPQEEHLVDIQYASPTPTHKPIWIWVVAGVAIIFIVVFLFYG